MKNFLTVTLMPQLWHGQQILVCFIFLLLLFCMPRSGWSQASQTDIVYISGTTYQLVYNQEDPCDPVAFSGVEFYLVVTGTDPEITLSAPAGSWLFAGDDDPVLFVDEPEVCGSTYKFPILALRSDNEPQSGEGMYLQVDVDDGILVAVEDFPTKRVLGPQVQAGEATALLNWTGKSPANLKTLRVVDLHGVDVLQWESQQSHQALERLWTTLPHGVFILVATFDDGSSQVKKVLRGTSTNP